ncbi:hypothetical protein [Vibrio tapetis]|uniref:Uncharacterized protein n=1 Tax=Vibrio tapetis subsp. tapetis TaxID=1671868 RepID=A0A2N8ZJC7_9VIBR|nr:hypothetical protein [Vibrio tapetis]SON52010.1 conserved protein of unknown function [Vibrio tapetis subsp. tapetis]
MLLREFKTHYKQGNLDDVIAVPSAKGDGYYLMVKSKKWGVNSFLENSRDLKPRLFKTQHAMMNAAKDIGFNRAAIETTLA